jgi:hypothetical protein
LAGFATLKRRNQRAALHKFGMHRLCQRLCRPTLPEGWAILFASLAAIAYDRCHLSAGDIDCHVSSPIIYPKNTGGPLEVLAR